MEFEEFAKQFRQRTTQRMMEFEKALAAAQQRVEHAVAAPAPRRTPPASQTSPQAEQPLRTRRGAARGQVQGLLRKG
ncbi:hypothetical protein B842_02070 [Corynebacterium humireducens NBRC 106098 = DSM 45392]|uniref:Uncharacterized protein n=1 Tax=Corynebacterium humireducens NBRC 106098 = DSM 45392 TaxID=1223515 RepID=A0A0B5D5B7_9CORY|nr:hypothetical protein [Corynebacterium humireducens]AJE32267.1 hypothetical protein B842_02070 [Corynebacterium humireducens NBRC 106098 = DSM 45392]